MPRRRIFYSVSLFLSLFWVRFFGVWTDATAGLAWTERQSARDLGAVAQLLFVQQDQLGRLYVGGAGLLVHDGQAWKTYSIGGAQGVRTLRFGPDGRIWVGALNEFGYLTEPSTGHFEYHSLIPFLPEAERIVGHTWGCGLVGSSVYFIGREKLHRWDGAAFRTWTYPTESRLFPLTLGTETWFQHLDTGLYRLTEAGPELEFDRTQLPAAGILGLFRDETGLVVVSSDGCYRPGHPPVRVFDGEVNRFITENRLTTYIRLPDGHHLIGTLNGGIAIVSPAGRLLRTLDARDGAVNTIMHLFLAAPGDRTWGVALNEIFRFDASGTVTVFNAHNGLEGGVLAMTTTGDGAILVSNPNGNYRLVTGDRVAHFERIPELKENYYTLRGGARGLLLGRHGGIDHYDGRTLSTLYNVQAKGVYRIVPSWFPAGSYLLSEGDALVRLQPQEGSAFRHERFARIPDFADSLAEDGQGRVWSGTLSLGAFVTDPGSGETRPVLNPDTGAPLKGAVCLSRSESDLLLFAHELVLRAAPDGNGLARLCSLPGVEPILTLPMEDERSSLLAFKRPGASTASPWGQGLGVLSIDRNGHPAWHELDLPAMETIGLPQVLQFSKENGRRILWLGGTEGLLRVDFERLPRMAAPASPVIRLESVPTAAPGQRLEFPFEGHRLGFRVFIGDPAHNRDWLLQTRLTNNGGAWSAPTSLRAFDFSNLSEGEYRFEARTVNAAGLTSEPAVFTFRILPPWYRSPLAYGVYALLLAGAVGATIRFREQRLRAQQEELEHLVQLRTAELVKANAAKDEFLAGISHEIRNPMNGVIGIAESLRTDNLGAEARHKFSLLRQCASHLASLLEDLLDLSRMQAGVIEIESRAFDVHELVAAVAAMAAADSEKYRIPVETAISPAVPRLLQGDPRRVRQILLNFVGNALKFSGRGKVELTVWCQPPGPDGRMEISFAVSDEGPGIPAEEAKRLFNRFERGAAARQGRAPGTGLGLALCKGYAEKMGGRVWLESEPGRGSCFYFSAPFAPVAEPAGATEPAPPPPAAARPALVVDDQEYNRIVLVDLLANLGYRAVAASNGREALDLARRHDFVLVFLDYDLADMTGLEVARTLRTLPNATARARIFATTAFNTPEKHRQCLEAGMDAILGKPVTSERLRRALGPAAPEADRTSPPATPPADPLANLRLLATKKNVPFAAERALYLAELDDELARLETALDQQSAAAATQYAHRLCGRCSFIQEDETERLLRRIEEGAGRGQWEEVRRLRGPLSASVAALRLRLSSASPDAPHA